MQPLPGKVFHQSLGARVTEHALNLQFQYRGILQPAGLGDCQKLVVGYAAPKKERQPGGQFQVADAEVCAWLRIRRITLDAEEKFGADQQAFEGCPDPRFKVALAPS